MELLKSIFLASLILIIGCRNTPENEGKRIVDLNNDNKGAERFAIEKKEGYTVLRIKNPWQGAGHISMTSYLVNRGSELPEGIDSADAIFVPVRNIICMSTTHTAMISALGEENTITGVSGTTFTFSEVLKKKIENGLIKDVGYEASLNNELIINLSPDLIMMYGIGNESAGYVNKISELGVKVLFNADYLETDPLSKAEWIKLFGVLYCKEKKADSIFIAEVETYNSIKEYINLNIRSRPKVMLGLPYKDTWFISPGNSYISKMIADAGGDYLWKDTKSEISMPFGLENVFIRAMKADFWLNTGSISARDDIAAIDHRLSDLPCYKKGNLYNNTGRITPDGGNDYWENGSVYPHLILKDIACILHPELFKDHKLFFYRKIL